MKYRFKRNQLFRKRLDMPERILGKVYNNTLTFQEYIEYNLEDKVPISCLKDVHRNVVERFGVERSKGLDWDLIDLKGYELIWTIKDIDETADNINEELYRFVKDDMRPKDYTSMMKKVYSDYVLDDPEVAENLQNDFNSGYLKITDMVSIWDKVKNKDLSLCLKNDYYNKDSVTADELKKFMNEYHGLLALLDDPTEIYNLIIITYRSDKESAEKKAYFKKVVDKILDKTIDSNSFKPITLTDKQYKVIFQYTSIKDYLYKKLGNEYADKVMDELDGRDPSYLLELPIPFDVFINKKVLIFIETYGLDNIVDFDDECGHFFTTNNCEILKSMYDMYIHYGANEHDKTRTIFTKKVYDKKGNYVERHYTKEEFYEAIRRMIIYGPTDPNYTKQHLDYRVINGEFRELNPELFVDEKAPTVFQDAFYTKSLSPIFIRDNFNCVSYLIGKKLSTIFCPLSVKISKDETGLYYRFENVYKFLEEKLDFEETIKIVTDYADVFEIIFSSYDKLSKITSIVPIQFSNDDTKDDIITKINDKLYELIIKANIKYSSNLSKSMKEIYPNVFIGFKVPKKIHTMFYNREINADYIINNPDDKKYFEGLDIELFFNYMPITIVSKNTSKDDKKNIKKTENLVSFVKTLFGNEEGLSILLSYNTYLNKVNNNLGFNKVEFKEEISAEEFLTQIDCLIYLNIIKGNILYDENMPNHFKAAYPSLFLLDNTSDDIKYKFYNRLFTLDDFYENPVLMKHFANTDIACCLDTTFSYMIGLFSSNDFLDIIKICGENIKSDNKLFNYLRTKTEELITIPALGDLIYEYFEENDENLKYLIILNKLGYDNEKVRKLTEKFKDLLTLRTDLSSDMLLYSKLLDNNVIEQYGYDVIITILKYSVDGTKVIVKAINDNDKLLPQAISYLKRLPIYNEELLVSFITNYENSKSLISSLINDNIILNNNELVNLKTLLLQKNKFNIQNIKDLSNYETYRNNIIKDKIESDNINIVCDGIFEKLFNTSLKEINRVFNIYGLNYKDFVKEYLVDTNYLSIEYQALIEIIREILTVDDIEKLKKRYLDFKNIEDIYPSIDSLEICLKKYYGKLYKDSLFKASFEDEKGISYTTIMGVDATEMQDIEGNYMTSQKKIDVVNLDGIDFKILVSNLSSNKYFPTVYDTIKTNPSKWNELNMGNYLVTNMISNIYMGCIEHCDHDTVYYGFNDIADTSIKLMNHRDINIDNITLNEFMIPDVLQTSSTSYNTIVLDLYSGSKNEYHHRIQPNCIVCFDDYISSESKRAAHYFNIPIYMIHRDKYSLHNTEIIDEYQTIEIDSFTKDDVAKLLYSREIILSERYDVFLKIVDKLLQNRKITSEYALELLRCAKEILDAYMVHNDLSTLDLKKLNDKIKELTDEEVN